MGGYPFGRSQGQIAQSWPSRTLFTSSESSAAKGPEPACRPHKSSAPQLPSGTNPALFGGNEADAELGRLGISRERLSAGDRDAKCPLSTHCGHSASGSWCGLAQARISRSMWVTIVSRAKGSIVAVANACPPSIAIGLNA